MNSDCYSVSCDKSRILLVEDENKVLQVFHRVLSIGFPRHVIDVAVNGAEAVTAFSGAHQAVLLMDLHLPIMDGETAFHEIEKLCTKENWEPPSVVFCTGFAPPGTINDIISGNPAHDMLLKPVSNAVLVDRLRDKLSRF